VIGQEKTSCPDCGVDPGQRHLEGCDVARCSMCGVQLLSCEKHLDAAPDVWTGHWPGVLECEERGWYTRFDSSRGGWTPCSKDDPGAIPDLNRWTYFRHSGVDGLYGQQE
jgi:hypothetical protein